MIPKPTSHFIGLSLSSDLFLALFEKLSWYIDYYDIQMSLELQRLDSIHITLYYLSQTLSDRDRELYISFREGHAELISLSLGELSYFYQDNTPCILYISLWEVEKISLINQQLSHLFHHDDIIENWYSYIPHITLIRILDPDIFALHRQAIERIIQDFLQDSIDISLTSIISLYAVDSRIHPELQESIL